MQHHYLTEGGDTVNVHASVRNLPVLDRPYDGPSYELVVTATSIESAEEAEKALKEWAAYIAFELGKEIGYQP
jgi:hypothetical protein